MRGGTPQDIPERDLFAARQQADLPFINLSEQECSLQASREPSWPRPEHIVTMNE